MIYFCWHGDWLTENWRVTVVLEPTVWVVRRVDGRSVRNVVTERITVTAVAAVAAVAAVTSEPESRLHLAICRRPWRRRIHRSGSFRNSRKGVAENDGPNQNLLGKFQFSLAPLQSNRSDQIWRLEDALELTINLQNMADFCFVIKCLQSPRFCSLLSEAALSTKTFI